MIAISLSVLGTTLKQLTLNEIAQKSTSIVRGKAYPGYIAARGSVLYTHYTVQVSEVWKGTPQSTVDVAVPGGSLKSITQTYSGAPLLTKGQDYVLFLWTGGSGLTQVIGLSQGLFTIMTNPSGTQIVGRAAATEQMLGAKGTSIEDTNFALPLTDFRANVEQALAGKGGSQ